MKWSKRLQILFVFIISVIIIVPFYITFLSAFKTTKDIVANPLMPINLTIQNFVDVFGSSWKNILGMYRNSMINTVSSIGFLMLTAPLAGYYLGRNKTKLSSFLFVFLLAGMMIPDAVTIIPLIDMFVKFGIIGNVYSVVLFNVGARSALTIMLYTKFIKTIPYELEESAYIDGATKYQTFYKIVLPLLKPCTATALIFVGMNIWNDFLMPMYLLNGSSSQTITVGIFSAIGEYTENWGHVFTWVVIAASPVLILFVSAQKFFIKGLTSGAVKG